MNFDGAIFDMDGVITKTALVHASAWKRMFDEFLQRRHAETGEAFREFTPADYLAFVDGRPRYEGVRAFLNSRDILLPFGKPSDRPDAQTICGLGNRKNEFFNRVIDEEGVEVYDSTICLIRQLLCKGIQVGVATSSKNCVRVLERAGVAQLFATRVDGVISAEMGLKGKPEPDIFATACDNLGVNASRAMIVEDAVAGVQAASRGRFGLTLGVARDNNAEELRRNGADLVVRDLSEIGLEEIDGWFASTHEG